MKIIKKRKNKIPVKNAITDVSNIIQIHVSPPSESLNDINIEIL